MIERHLGLVDRNRVDDGHLDGARAHSVIAVRLRPSGCRCHGACLRHTDGHREGAGPVAGVRVREVEGLAVKREVLDATAVTIVDRRGPLVISGIGKGSGAMERLALEDRDLGICVQRHGRVDVIHDDRGGGGGRLIHAVVYRDRNRIGSVVGVGVLEVEVQGGQGEVLDPTAVTVDDCRRPGIRVWILERSRAREGVTLLDVPIRTCVDLGWLIGSLALVARRHCGSPGSLQSTARGQKDRSRR